MLYNHHLLCQLPYSIHFDTDKFMDCISASIDGGLVNAGHWPDAPASEINVAHQAQPASSTEGMDGVVFPLSSQFPSRQQPMEFVVNKLFFKYAKPITSIAKSGIINHLPVAWRPLMAAYDTLRPTRNLGMLN